MCQFFRVSRSGYYDYVKRLAKPEHDANLANFIREQQERCDKTYGYRRMWNCRFVNDVLQRGKRRKDEFGRAPVEGAHGEIVVFSIPDSKLFLEVLEGKEFV